VLFLAALVAFAVARAGVRRVELADARLAGLRAGAAALRRPADAVALAAFVDLAALAAFARVAGRAVDRALPVPVLLARGEAAGARLAVFAALAALAWRAGRLVPLEAAAFSADAS